MKITWLKYEKNRKIVVHLAIIFTMSIGLILRVAKDIRRPFKDPGRC